MMKFLTLKEYEYITGKELIDSEENFFDINTLFEDEKEYIDIEKLIKVIASFSNKKNKQTIRYEIEKIIETSEEYNELIDNIGNKKFLNKYDFIGGMDNYIYKFKIDGKKINIDEYENELINKKIIYISEEKIPGYCIFGMIINKENLSFILNFLLKIYKN